MAFAAYNFHIQDPAGNDVGGALLEVRRESDGGLATLFSDRDGTVALGNPFTSLTATGRFYVVGGCYKITVTSAVPGASVIWRHVAIGTAAEHDFEEFLPSAVRELLPGPRTYFVRKDGSNNNTGLADSAAGAFLTIGRAMTQMTRIDQNGHAVTVQVRADGAPPTIYKEIISLPNVVGYRSTGNLQLIGDIANPANIVIDQSHLVASINTTTNEITFTTAHGFVLNQRVHFRVMPGGTAPAVTGAPGGVLPQSPTDVFVKSIPNATTITISLTEGGATADITSAGSGVIRASFGTLCIQANGLYVVWQVRGFTLHAPDGNGFGIHNTASRVEFGNMDFDQCGFCHVLFTDNGSGALIGGGYNIRGKTTQSFHYLTQQQSQIVTINSLLTSTLGKATYRAAFTTVGLGVSMHRGDGMRFGTLVTANATTNQITWTAHGLAENDPVQIYPDSLPTSVAPAPLSYGTAYYAHIIDTNTIQLMAAPSGAIIDLTTAGTAGQRAISFEGARSSVEATCIIFPPTGNFPGTP